MSEVEEKNEVKAAEVAEQAPAVTTENGATTEVEVPSTDSVMKDVDSAAPAKDEEVKEKVEVSAVRDEAKHEAKEEAAISTGKYADKRQSRYTKQNKFDTSSLPESKDPSLIRGQVSSDLSRLPYTIC